MNMLLDKIKRRYFTWRNITALNSSILRRAEQDAYDLIYSHSSRNTILYEDKQKLRDDAFGKRLDEGLILEFGVFKGNTINRFARLAQRDTDLRKIYGFDSFVGFSETWTGVEDVFPSSRFDRKGVHPNVENNVVLIDGFIEETLPEFIKNNEIDKVSFIHIDTDTFSPAYTVLSQLKPYLVPGSIVVFDELCGYPNWRNHEWLALNKVFDKSAYEYLGFSVGSRRPNLMNASIRIL